MVTIFDSLRQHTVSRLLAVALLATLAACASNPPPPPVDDGSGGTGQTSGGTADGGDSGIDSSKLNQRGLLGIEKSDRSKFVDPNNPLSTRTIYFEFDSSRIQPKFRENIQAHARYLSEHPDVQLRLEGHTDERGTREYNVALGERRAESVQEALEIAGASSNQISTLSFGEERPAELGSGEEAYRKNRRVELIYVEE